MTTTSPPGVLGKHQLIELIEQKVINGVSDPQCSAGPSAVDLTLSDEGWWMYGSIKGRQNHRYSEVVNNPKYCMRGIDLSDPIVMHPKYTYVVRLLESLDLTGYPQLYGSASGKSSIGRLDVLVRLIADYSAEYDDIPSVEISGRTKIDLYVEITPISFPIMVKAGVKLNQLRFTLGTPIELDRPNRSELGMDALKNYSRLLLGSDGVPVAVNDVERLTVDLTPVAPGHPVDPDITKENSSAGNTIAFEARENVTEPIDLTISAVHCDPRRYWRPIQCGQNHGDTIRIVPERFYILRSRERFRLPLDVAAYVHAMTETIGDLRIHYAGFIHPGFGLLRDGGTPLIFEIRGHNVTTFLRDSERIAVIRYFKMSEPVSEDDIDSNGYQEQELTLSRYFTRW